MPKTHKIRNFADSVKTVRKEQRRRDISRITDNVYAIAALPVLVLAFVGARKIVKSRNN